MCHAYLTFLFLPPPGSALLFVLEREGGLCHTSVHVCVSHTFIIIIIIFFLCVESFLR